ncbi:hypothetical protein LQZ18_04450 [Lachnospiraceae bacterium ZAX-1]
MTKVLEIKEGLRTIFGKFELYIMAGVKFALALTAFSIINRTMGYMERLHSISIVLVMALLCTFLPIHAVILFSCGLILAHLSALSLEVCVVASCILLLMFLMYFRFASDNGYNVVMNPLLFSLGIPQIMPVSIGLLKDPASIVSMLCTTIWFYFLKGIKENEAMFSATEEDTAAAKFTLALQQIIGNKELYLVVAALALTALTVYLIRRLSINHAWTIAICVGCSLDLTIMLVGYSVLEKGTKILGAVLGTLLSLLVNFGIEFFLYNLDYSRIERVQFEDDEYYYYVKAIPKSYVSTKEKQVKKINAQKRDTINKRELAEELDIDQDLLDD